MIKTNVLIIFKTRNTFFYYGTAAAALRMHLYVHGNPLRPLNILRFTVIVVPLRKTAPAIHTPSRGTYFPGTALPRAMKGRERSGDGMGTGRERDGTGREGAGTGRGQDGDGPRRPHRPHRKAVGRQRHIRRGRETIVRSEGKGAGRCHDVGNGGGDRGGWENGGKERRRKGDDGDGHKKRQGTASGPLSFFRRRR